MCNMNDVKADFDALLREYQVNLSSRIGNDSKDNLFDLSILNNDNYIRNIWFLVDNANDNMKDCFDGSQDSNHSADFYSNVLQAIHVYLTNEVSSEYYSFVQKWIDFMMNKVNIESIRDCNSRELCKQCFYVVLCDKLDHNSNNINNINHINYITDKREFMNHILLILFEHCDYQFQYHILMYHFELILRFVADKWDRILSWYRIQNTHCQAAHIDLEQKTALDEKNNDVDDAACNLSIFTVGLILFPSSLMLQ